jgi:SAM-dependent methyltransferase
LTDDAVLGYYGRGIEGGRLGAGTSRIEFARTQELLQRFLPSPPARVLDVGGGPGAYASWLAERGYAVRLVDPVPLHVEQAAAAGKRYGFSAVLGDARHLDEPDDAYEAVLLLGPLYHLTEHGDRVRALEEAKRVVRPGGIVVAAAISRFASLFDGLRQGFLAAPEFRRIVARDLADGQHRNPEGRADWFTTAFFHHPSQLSQEIADAALDLEALLGVEGPGWLMRDDLWDDDEGREAILLAARAVESEPTLLGLSAHLLAVARRNR